MNEPALDPSRCPICGESNACGMAAGSTECWCFTATIPSEVMELIPEAARGVICICEACAKRGAAQRRVLPVA